MFDWQIEEDAKLARRVFAAVIRPRLQAHPPVVRLRSQFDPPGALQKYTELMERSRPLPGSRMSFGSS